jgi:ankyrin repeat protein
MIMIIQDSPPRLDDLLSQLQIPNLETSNLDKLKKWIRTNITSTFPDNAEKDRIKQVFNAYKTLNQQESLTSIIDNDYGYNVVHQAAKLGFDCFLEKCHEKLSPKILNMQSTMGQTPLHLAALEGNYPTLELLLEQGANSNIANKQNKYPIHLAAVMKGDEPLKKNCIYELLLTANKEALLASDNTGMNLLFAAINFNDLALVKAILAKCPELIKSVDRLGQNILHHVLINNNDNLLDYFLSHNNVDTLITELTNNYSTALILACRYGNATTVAKLCKNPKCLELIDKKDEHQKSAIEWASINGDEESINLLKENGARFD